MIAEPPLEPGGKAGLSAMGAEERAFPQAVSAAAEAGGAASLRQVATAVDKTDRAVEPPPADEPPILFLFPGSVGYGPSMAAFATGLGRVARVVPIRYPNLQLILSGQDTLAAMATAGLAQVLRHQPGGPVLLLGHSLGGAVAFEVAALLLAAGRPIRFLGLLDTSLLGERSAYLETVVRTVYRIRSNRVTATRMACRALAKVTVALGCQARLAGWVDRHAKGQFNATCFRIKLELQEVLRAKAFFAWLAAPKPTLPLSGTLFRCARKGMPQALGWDKALAGLDIVPIAGGHTDLVMEPHLATNHPLIEKAVRRSLASPQPRRREETPPAPDLADGGLVAGA